jgi:hypothetical protein
LDFERGQAQQTKVERQRAQAFHETAGVVKVFVFAFAFAFSLAAFWLLLLFLSLLLPFLVGYLTLPPQNALLSKPF